MRVILAAVIIGLGLFKLFATFRGLDQPVAMDQAQIARQVAQGNGFTTLFLRPMEMKAEADRKEKINRTKSDEQERILDLTTFRDTNHAPLNVYALAAALKISGYDNFETGRMTIGGSHIYGGDRVVAGTSLFFFLLSMALAYVLVARLFDELVAASTIAFMALSDLLLSYAVSGLPQPLMMCCLMGALNFLLSAVNAYDVGDRTSTLVQLCLCSLCVALLCLSGWIALWIAVGLIIFCAVYFRPFGAFAVPTLLIVGFSILFPLLGNISATGNVMGNAFYSLYNCLGGVEDLVQRTTAAGGLPLNNSSFILRLCGFTFDQLNTMYVAMGGIIVTPFFFLCLLNRYKTARAEGLKWAIFSMWFFACLGMALFGVTGTISASQLHPLFTPVFTAFGVSLVFNFLARLKLGTSFGAARGLAIFLMVLISSGTFLFNLPGQLRYGLWVKTGRPFYPPYYPTALNAVSEDKDKAPTLAAITNDQDIVVTDQPWAVAWYANRRALWLPLRVDDYATELEPIITKSGLKVQGFLITPSSHSPNRDTPSTRYGGMKGIVQENGDFAPLAMEGTLLQLLPRHNFLFADQFTQTADKSATSKPMGSVVSSSGQFPFRTFILGADMMYYSRENVRDQQ